MTLTIYEVPTTLHRCSSPYISVPKNRGHCDQVLRFRTVRDTSVKVFIAILPTSIIDNWKQNVRHGGSETNETLTRSNISTKGITLLMFEEHLVDTLLGCLFQSSLLPPSTRHSLHCQNERSRQPIAKMRLIQVISMPRTNQSIRITSHPPTRYIYIYSNCSATNVDSHVRPSALSKPTGEGVDIGGRRRGNATELLRVEPTRPVDWF